MKHNEYNELFLQFKGVYKCPTLRDAEDSFNKLIGKSKYEGLFIINVIIGIINVVIGIINGIICFIIGIIGIINVIIGIINVIIGIINYWDYISNITVIITIITTSGQS